MDMALILAAARFHLACFVGNNDLMNVAKVDLKEAPANAIAKSVRASYEALQPDSDLGPRVETAAWGIVKMDRSTKRITPWSDGRPYLSYRPDLTLEEMYRVNRSMPMDDEVPA